MAPPIFRYSSSQQVVYANYMELGWHLYPPMYWRYIEHRILWRGTYGRPYRYKDDISVSRCQNPHLNDRKITIVNWYDAFKFKSLKSGMCSELKWNNVVFSSRYTMRNTANWRQWDIVGVDEIIHCSLGFWQIDMQITKASKTPWPIPHLPDMCCIYHTTGYNWMQGIRWMFHTSF